jgi:hypothetical protein
VRSDADCSVFVIAQSITNAGITNFNPLIISGFGYSQSKTTLMATPQAAVALVAQVILSTIAYFVPNIRCALWMFACLPALAGAVIVHGKPCWTVTDQWRSADISGRSCHTPAHCAGRCVPHGLLQ